jgi:hypothetical protein
MPSHADDSVLLPPSDAGDGIAKMTLAVALLMTMPPGLIYI